MADGYQHLTRQFLDLWQKQLATMMNDKDFIHAMLDFLQKPEYGASPFNPGQNHAASAFTHAANAGIAPDATGAGAFPLYELERRLRACEQRIEQLERAAAERQTGKEAAKPVSAGSGRGKRGKKAAD